MDNLHINNTAPTRTCLPPPGFSSASNQVNSYGISIPRNTGRLFYVFFVLKIITNIIYVTYFSTKCLGVKTNKCFMNVKLY